MSGLNPPLTKHDFTNTCWEDVVKSSESKDCMIYCIAFDKKAKEAQELGNFREKAVFEILATVTMAEINPQSKQEFFAEVFKDMTDEQLNFLAEIAPEISDPELQARVADFLWLIGNKRDRYRMAQLSIPAYLKSATTLENPEHWTDCCDRIERAFRLARKINHQYEVVFAHIEEVLDRYQGEKLWGLSLTLMELLEEHKCGEPVKYAALAEKAATLAESSSNWPIARKFWEIKAKWHCMEKNKSEKRAASMSAAETYVEEAESALKRNPPSYMAASGFLQQAVEAFRKIPGTKARVEELHKRLLQYQEKSRNEMMTISHKMDISELVEKARNHVRGKNLQEALFTLALLGAPTHVSKLKQQVQQDADNSLGIHLVPNVIINEMGKTVASQPDSVFSSDPKKAERATHFYMCLKAIEYYKLQAQAYIEAARDQINLEHCVRLDDILFIVSNSPFIPPDREYLFAKGLYAGLTGDFFTSTHILIPQIENSIRYIMWQRGIITSKLDDNGIQDEFSLSKSLAHSEITSIFDENTLFELRCLLVEHAGSNLRNRMAHGLICDAEFRSPLMSYLWCLTLRLCCLPILIHQQQVEQSNTSTDAI